MPGGGRSRVQARQVAGSGARSRALPEPGGLPGGGGVSPDLFFLPLGNTHGELREHFLRGFIWTPGSFCSLGCLELGVVLLPQLCQVAWSHTCASDARPGNIFPGGFRLGRETEVVVPT